MPLLSPSAAEFSENVDGEEAGEGHGTEKCGLGVFVRFDQELRTAQLAEIDQMRQMSADRGGVEQTP